MTSIDTSTAGVTDSVAAPRTPAAEWLARIDVVPVATPRALPNEPAWLPTAAMAASFELQLTASVRFCVVESLNRPMAVKLRV